MFVTINDNFLKHMKWFLNESSFFFWGCIDELEWYLIRDVMVMRVLNKQPIVQTFVGHIKKHFPFVEYVEMLQFFLLYIFEIWFVILV